MSKLITLGFMLISSLSFSQIGINDDYFDLNLKNKPKKVISISNFSFHDYFQDEYRYLLEYTLISQIQLHHMYFDSLGRISKEFFSDVMHPCGRWEIQNYNLTQYYNDSIVRFEKLPNGTMILKEKRYLNKLGHSSEIIINNQLLKDTLTFVRGDDNRIKESYRKSYGIDTDQIIKTLYTRNEIGDIVVEQSFEERDGALWKEPEILETITTYKYVYDDYNNWIIRITFENGEIQLITSRQIEY